MEELDDMEEFNPDDWAIVKSMSNKLDGESTGYEIHKINGTHEDYHAQIYYSREIRDNVMELFPYHQNICKRSDGYMGKIFEMFRQWYKLNNIAE